MGHHGVLCPSIRRFWSVAQMTFLIFMLSGCSGKSQSDQRLLAVFSDFDFVGAFPYAAEG